MHTQGDFRADLEKYYRIEFRGRVPSLRRRVKLWLTNFGFHCVAVYRLGRFCRAARIRGNPLAWALIPGFEVLAFLVKLLFQVDVFAADIGPGFYIGHVGTIYIGPTSVGANFSVTHNVTVGSGSGGGAHGLPVLGRDVWIGTGSILYGNIAIGDGVTVNGGTVLSRSVPDRCLAGGNPGRIILRNYDNAHLFALPGAALPDGDAIPSDPPVSARVAEAPADPVPEAMAAPAAKPRDPPVSAPAAVHAGGAAVPACAASAIGAAAPASSVPPASAVELAVEKVREKAVQIAMEEAVPVVATAASASITGAAEMRGGAEMGGAGQVGSIHPLASGREAGAPVGLPQDGSADTHKN